MQTIAIGDQPTMKRELQARSAVFVRQKPLGGVHTWIYKTPDGTYLLVRKHPTSPDAFSMASAASCDCG